jgi:hypothetical protein
MSSSIPTGTPKKTILTIKGSVIGSPKTISEQFPVAVGAIKFNASDVPLGELTKGKTRMAYLSGYNTATDTMVVKFTGAPDYIVPHAVPDTVIPGGLTTATFYLRLVASSAVGAQHRHHRRLGYSAAPNKHPPKQARPAST